MAKNDPIFNAESMKHLFRIVVGILLLFMPFVILCFYGRIKRRGVKFMLWAHFVLTAAVLFGYVCGELSAANWRLMPIIGSSIMVCVCGLRDLVSDLAVFRVEEGEAMREPTEEDLSLDPEVKPRAVQEISAKKASEVVLSRVCAAILALTLLSSLVFANEISEMPADYGRDNTNHRLAEFLVGEGLEYGYATFWYAQAITLLSDSEVRVRNMDVSDSKGVVGRHYQSSLDWYNDQEGVSEYFVILSSSEYKKVFTTRAWQAWMDEYYLRHYEDPNDAKGFQIYVFSENVLRDFGSDARAE